MPLTEMKEKAAGAATSRSAAMQISGDAIIGKPVTRIDGRLKVTGAAQYSAEYDFPNLAHAAILQSTIARGRIREIDTKDAEALPGVLAVITYKNAPRIQKITPDMTSVSFPGEKDLLPLQSNEIFYNGQHIAVVVADTFERATFAATRIKVIYDAQKPVATIEQGRKNAFKPKDFLGQPAQIQRGNAKAKMRDAAVRVDHTYTTPTEHHNPMEPHATIAVWDGPNLTVYDATQSIIGTQEYVAQTLGLTYDNSRAVARFIGGGFGCKGVYWHHTTLAATAARIAGRPVKLELTRQQMFSGTGHRSETIQRVALGADKSGKLLSLEHETTAYTSMVDHFLEPAGLGTSKILYDTQDAEISHLVVPVNRGTPTFMRAPGESVGTYALECAMDELAVALNIDPIQLRLMNHADKDPDTGKPWSSKHLKECYAQGAALIGWERRNPKPRSMRKDGVLVGLGMATATYPGYRMPSSARVEILADGRVMVYSSAMDIGTGTYTAAAILAADALGVGVKQAQVILGDSKLPRAPGSGGSMTMASVGPAIREACLSAKSKILKMALSDKNSPLFGATPDAVDVRDGRIALQSDAAKSETYADILTRAKVEKITGEADSKPGQMSDADVKKFAGCYGARARRAAQADQNPYTFQSFGAQFAEVHVDPVLGTIRVARFASVMDAGTILNAKAAESQLYGGIVFGIGMALLEATQVDPRSARIMNADLAEYHVPVNADVPQITARFIGEPDPHISEIGSRGVGEIGITGVAAAIANAIYNATGKRVRDLPITLDKVI